MPLFHLSEYLAALVIVGHRLYNWIGLLTDGTYLTPSDTVRASLQRESFQGRSHLD